MSKSICKKESELRVAMVGTTSTYSSLLTKVVQFIRGSQVLGTITLDILTIDCLVCSCSCATGYLCKRASLCRNEEILIGSLGPCVVSMQSLFTVSCVRNVRCEP